MYSVFYFGVTVFGLVAVCLVWDLGLRKLLLDIFRERLFELRFRLFSLAAKNELEFNDEAYRSIETLLCGLLRYAHRVTFMCFLFSSVEQNEAKNAKEYVDFHKQIRLKISRTSPAVQRELNSILAETSRAVIIYTSLSSLSLMITLPFIGVLHSFNLLRNFH